jgi:hypothetical protein
MRFLCIHLYFHDSCKVEHLHYYVSQSMFLIHVRGLDTQLELSALSESMSSQGQPLSLLPCTYDSPCQENGQRMAVPGPYLAVGEPVSPESENSTGGDSAREVEVIMVSG